MAIETPTGWTQDRLSEFLESSFRNSLAFFERRRGAWERLKEIDGAFLALGESRPLGIPAFFLFRAHSTFRAAVRSVTSGQVPETYPLLRSALEWALYAAHVHGEDRRSEVWLRRHDGEAPDGSSTPESENSRRAVRNEFLVSRLFASLEVRSRDVHARTKNLHEDAIDLGAHPNERALTSSMRSEEEGTFQLDYTVPEDSLALELAVKRTCQVGVCCLDIFELLWSERFALLSLDATMDRLRHGL